MLDDNADDFHDRLIDLGDIYFGRITNNRSIIVRNNNHDIPLEFTLQTVIGSGDEESGEDPSELVLSLSDKVSEMAKIVSIEPMSQARFYVWLCPNPSRSSSSKGRGVELKEFSVNINCRLLKDFQHTIRIIGTCHYPELQVNVMEITFHGLIDLEDGVGDNMFKVKYFEARDNQVIRVQGRKGSR
jgi:hypothetical protein